MVLFSAPSALRFCATSPSAVVLTVWPSGVGELAAVREWLEASHAEVVHEADVPLTTELSSLLTVMALYDGEEWLETNAWYMEQPLPDGPPKGPWAGAKWKRALCYRAEDGRLQPRALVLDVSRATASLWSGKYAIRRTLAARSGNPGNSCIHLTDPQDASVLSAYRGELACDGSFAYACARALLHPASVAWLESGARGLAQAGMGGPAFRSAWGVYTDWLHEPPPECDADPADAFPPAPEGILCAG